jgi:hypothetical protein
MLPPGRGRPATKPAPTGSLTIVKTIGIVPIARFTAAVAGVVAVRITSGDDATSSFAKVPARCKSAFVQYRAIAALRPSIQPSRANSSTKVATNTRKSGLLSDNPISTPMWRTFSASANTVASPSVGVATTAANAATK